MEFTSWFWLVAILILLLGLGVFCTFFPYKVIRLRAKLQETMFRKSGLSDNDVDHLPFYSSLFGVDYSKRLKSEMKSPEKHQFLAIWIRILGFIILFSAFLVIWIVILAAKSGYF